MTVQTSMHVDTSMTVHISSAAWVMLSPFDGTGEAETQVEADAEASAPVDVAPSYSDNPAAPAVKEEDREEDVVATAQDSTPGGRCGQLAAAFKYPMLCKLVARNRGFSAGPA